MTEEELTKSLDNYFNRGIDAKRFIDTSRIPFICDDIRQLNRRVSEIHDNTADLPLMRKIVYGAVGVTLVTVLLAILYMVVKSSGH